MWISILLISIIVSVTIAQVSTFCSDSYASCGRCASNSGCVWCESSEATFVKGCVPASFAPICGMLGGALFNTQNRASCPPGPPPVCADNLDCVSCVGDQTTPTACAFCYTGSGTFQGKCKPSTVSCDGTQLSQQSMCSAIPPAPATPAPTLDACVQSMNSTSCAACTANANCRFCDISMGLGVCVSSSLGACPLGVMKTAAQCGNAPDCASVQSCSGCLATSGCAYCKGTTTPSVCLPQLLALAGCQAVNGNVVLSTLQCPAGDGTRPPTPPPSTLRFATTTSEGSTETFRDTSSPAATPTDDNQPTDTVRTANPAPDTTTLLKVTFFTLTTTSANDATAPTSRLSLLLVSTMFAVVY